MLYLRDCYPKFDSLMYSELAFLVFEQLPTYSPELNPVEQCWQMMKNVFMANFVPTCVEELESKAVESAQILNNDPMLLASFFHHAKLAL